MEIKSYGVPHLVKKMTFYFDDITYCERKKGSIRVYVNGEKLFTIDSNIDKTEFMEDIKKEKNTSKILLGKSKKKK